jgi:CubicO group peptidase (beta-lactamase class C family)
VPHWFVRAWPAAGAIRSTAADMGKFLEANLGVASSGASPLLRNAMKFAQKGYFQTPKFMQGLAWVDYSNGLVTKDGSTDGASSYIALDPAKQIGVVVLTNKTHLPVGRPAEAILHKAM